MTDRYGKFKFFQEALKRSKQDNEIIEVGPLENHEVKKVRSSLYRAARSVHMEPFSILNRETGMLLVAEKNVARGKIKLFN